MSLAHRRRSGKPQYIESFAAITRGFAVAPCGSSEASRVVAALKGAESPFATRDVSVNIGGIKQAVGETGVAASNVSQLAKAPGHTADTLRGEVEGFLVEIRAA
jgi:hypothetical protein